MAKKPLFPPVFAPLVNRPMVDDFTLRAARLQTTQKPPGATLSQDIPLRTHPLWSGNNSLGFELDLEQDANSSEVFGRTVLKLDEWGMPDVWTIALSTNFVPVDFSNGVRPDSPAFALEGSLEWGSGGASDNLTLDWVTGTVLRLPMNALNIKIRGLVGTSIGGVDATVPSDLRARVTLAKGPLDGLPPQLSRNVLAVLNTPAPWIGAINVPRYAKSFVPFGRDQASADRLFAAGNYWVFYANSPALPGVGQIVSMLRAQDALQYMGGEGIPIPAPARLVGFINTVIPDDVRVKLVFNLCV